MTAPVTAPESPVTTEKSYIDYIKQARAAIRGIATGNVKVTTAYRSWLNAVANIFCSAEDLGEDRSVRLAAWNKVNDDIGLDDETYAASGSTRSMLKKVCLLDVTEAYLSVWTPEEYLTAPAKGTLTLRDAYDALRGKQPTVKNSQSIDNIIKAAVKKIRKLHADKIERVDFDALSLKVTML